MACVSSADEVAGKVPCLFAHRLAFFRATVVGSRVPFGFPKLRVLTDAAAFGPALADAAAGPALADAAAAAVAAAN